MDRPRSTSSSENTLYDPPEGEPEPAPDEEGEVELELEVPPELAERLAEVATHLGLSPAIVASRAIGMVCDEVGLVQGGDLTSTTLIQKYQTRLDLLHSLDYSLDPNVDSADEEADQPGHSGFGDEHDWDDVDGIIQRVSDSEE